MRSPKRIPIKYHTMNEAVTFVLKGRDGRILDNKILPPCTEFSHAIAYRVFAGCSGIMRGAESRYGVLEVIGRDKKVRQRINFDSALFHQWVESL